MRNRDTQAGQRVQHDPIALGLLVLFVLLIGIPLLWVGVPIPVSPTSLAKWLYILLSLIVCALIMASGAPGDQRATRFTLAFSYQLIAVGLIGLAVFGVGWVFAHFGATERVSETPSPSGTLSVAHDWIDEGALGGGSDVYVRGWLVPGLLDWHVELDVEYYPQSIRWIDDRTVTVNGRAYRVSELPVRLSWR